MAIIKSVAALLQGMGSGATQRSATATQASVGTSNTLTLTLPAGSAINTGMVRVQAKGFTGGGGFISCALRGSDGTNFWDIGYMAPTAAGAAGDFVSVVMEFITDVGLTSIVVIITFTAAGTGGTPVIDAEVWGALM